MSVFTGAEPGVAARREAADAGRLMAEAIESMRAITIARIQGHCVGGALVLAAACDLRVTAETTRFAIPEVDLGIPLAWGGNPRLGGDRRHDQGAGTDVPASDSREGSASGF